MTDLQFLTVMEPWQWPKDARKTLVDALVDPSASSDDRLAAAELAGELVVMNDEVAEALLAIVGNSKEAPDLRAKAAISFGPVLEQVEIEGFDEAFSEFDPDPVPISEDTYHRIRGLLRSVFEDSTTPKEVRRRVLEASVRGEEPWHQQAVREAYVSGDRDWKLTAVFGMRYVDGFDAQISEALTSSDPEILYEAVVGAGEREIDAAWARVVVLAQDSRTEKSLRLAAIEAVGNIRPGEATAVLVKITRSDDEDISEAASAAMHMAEDRTHFDDEFEGDFDEEEEEED